MTYVGSMLEHMNVKVVYSFRFYLILGPLGGVAVSPHYTASGYVCYFSFDTRIMAQSLMKIRRMFTTQLYMYFCLIIMMMVLKIKE